ncbi:uncharacterized protein LOC120619205 isoform X1 [Pteropus medius]|uniref:uncharacterized protein LOC120619205 isoform X1 n=1 Tax=Pteropus vampyrus TaxID=132908 RepID=UPI00196AE951|nr:uncharacterized protein LOC120619205 isoform X1 [Pteropus giganteus]
MQTWKSRRCGRCSSSSISADSASAGDTERCPPRASTRIPQSQEASKSQRVTWSHRLFIKCFLRLTDFREAKDRNRNRTSDTKIFPGSGNKGTIRPCGQVPEDENTPKSGGLAGWLSRYLPHSFPEFAHLLFQRRSTEAAARCWFRREVTEEGTLQGEAAWSSFPEDSNSPLKTLVVDSVSENADGQIDSGQGFAVFPCKKSQKCGLSISPATARVPGPPRLLKGEPGASSRWTSWQRARCCLGDVDIVVFDGKRL